MLFTTTLYISIQTKTQPMKKESCGLLSVGFAGELQTLYLSLAGYERNLPLACDSL